MTENKVHSGVDDEHEGVIKTSFINLFIIYKCPICFRPILSKTLAPIYISTRNNSFILDAIKWLEVNVGQAKNVSHIPCPCTIGSQGGSPAQESSQLLPMECDQTIC